MAWIQPAFQDNEDTKTSLSNPPPLARAHHTLTWLPGSLNDLESKDSHRKCAVLIGGANRETLLADTHVLLHQDGQWKWEELRVTPSGSRNALTPRARHSAVAIQGKLFVFGGIGGGEAVFSLDVEAKRWLRLKTTGRGPCARFAHAATSVQNIMYIIGGHTGTWFVNDVFCLDTLTRRWSQIHIQSSVHLPPSLNWTACTVMGSKILVFGGALGTPLEDAYVLRQPDRASAESNKRSLENMSLSGQSSRSSFALAMEAASQRNLHRGLKDDRACRWVRLPLACKQTERPCIGCDHSVFSRETPTGQQIVYFAGTTPRVAHNEAAAPGARLRDADHPVEKAMSVMWTIDLPIDANDEQTLLWEMHYLAGEQPPARVGTRCVLISEHISSEPALLFFGGTRTKLPFDISSRVPRSSLSSSSRQDLLTNLTHICDLAAFVPCKQLHAASKPPTARSGHSLTWVGPDPNNPHLECALLLGGDSCASGNNTVYWDAHLLAFNHKTQSWTWQFPLIDFSRGKIPQAKHPTPRHTPSLIMQQQEHIASTRARSARDDEFGTSREIPPPFTAHSATLFATPFPKLFVFGGGDLLTTSSELWILHMNAQYWSWEKGTPCLEKKPRALDDSLATLDWPGARAGHAACRHHGSLYVIGGACPNADKSRSNSGFMGQSDNQLLLNDIWTLDVDARLATATSGDRHLFQQLQWTRIPHAAKDGVFFRPRFGHSCTSVPLIDSLVVFGGCVKAHHSNSPMLLVNDLVAFHTGQQKWVRLGANEPAGRPPSPRYQHSCTLTFDANAASASRVRLCIMGGFGYTPQSSFDNAPAVEEARMRVPGPLKDVFIFDVRLRTWSEAKIAGEALPPLWRHAVFSRASQPSELIIFGGTRRKRDHNENEFPPTFEDCNEIWRLDSTWESPTQALLSM